MRKLSQVPSVLSDARSGPLPPGGAAWLGKSTLCIPTSKLGSGSEGRGYDRQSTAGDVDSRCRSFSLIRCRDAENFNIGIVLTSENSLVHAK